MNDERHINDRLQTAAARLTPPESLPDRREDLYAIDDIMDHYLVPGCSVALFEGGEIVGSTGYGTTARGNDQPVDAGTIFQACSISKAVTAIGALRLVESGALALDEDVNHYLSSWTIPGNDGWQPVVTLRHVLTHTAGLTYCWFPGYERGAPTPTTRQTLTGESPANTPPVRVVGIPGAEYRYSGAHYAVVEMLMEDITGEPFPSLMQHLVFDPLGMDNSSFDQAYPESRTGTVATGHDLAGVPLEGGWRVQPEHAGAGLWTTPSDLCTLSIAVQHAWSGHANELFGQDIAKDMLTPGPGNRGLGWQMQALDGRSWFEHGGSNVGYKCHTIAATDQNYGAAIMTNGDAGPAVYARLFQAIASEYGWPEAVMPGHASIADRPRPAGPQPDRELLQACTGHFRLATGLSLQIRLQDGALNLLAGDQLPIALQPVSERSFLARDVNATISFQQAQDGAVVGLAFRQFGDAIIGKRAN